MEKSFKDWTRDDLYFQFNLKKAKTTLLELANWLANTFTLESSKQNYLTFLLDRAKEYITVWNEMELQVKFIMPIIDLVNFDMPDAFISAFLERKLSAKLDGISLHGKVDWMVARGQSQPNVPFFFIHEYKKEKGSDNDPLAQLLVTMLAAQTLNQAANQQLSLLFKHEPDAPIYGCYIIGRNWFFVVLKDKVYSVSEAYNALKTEDLYQILGFLEERKRKILSTCIT